jgi:hypothetical protein
MRLATVSDLSLILSAFSLCSFSVRKTRPRPTQIAAFLPDDDHGKDNNQIEQTVSSTIRMTPAASRSKPP